MGSAVSLRNSGKSVPLLEEVSDFIISVRADLVEEVGADDNPEATPEEEQKSIPGSEERHAFFDKFQEGLDSDLAANVLKKIKCTTVESVISVLIHGEGDLTREELMFVASCAVQLADEAPTLASAALPVIGDGITGYDAAFDRSCEQVVSALAERLGASIDQLQDGGSIKDWKRGLELNEAMRRALLCQLRLKRAQENTVSIWMLDAMLRTTTSDVKRFSALLGVGKFDRTVRHIARQNRKLRDRVRALNVELADVDEERQKQKRGIDLRAEKIGVVRRIVGSASASLNSYFFDDSDSEEDYSYNA